MICNSTKFTVSPASTWESSHFQSKSVRMALPWKTRGRPFAELLCCRWDKATSKLECLWVILMSPALKCWHLHLLSGSCAAAGTGQSAPLGNDQPTEIFRYPCPSLCIDWRDWKQPAKCRCLHCCWRDESHPWVHRHCEGSSGAKQGDPGCSLPVGRLWLVCRMGQLWIFWAELGGMGKVHETTSPWDQESTLNVHRIPLLGYSGAQDDQIQCRVYRWTWLCLSLTLPGGSCSNFTPAG